MNTTDQTTQWVIELIDRLDILAAAIALGIIVHGIKPLFKGLCNFWEGYADNSGKNWIGQQKLWLHQRGKFALAEWWDDATSNIAGVLDRIYGFVEPKPESEKSEYESRQPIKNATSDISPEAANRSLIDQVLSSWRDFWQNQAFIRSLFIAYIYFYGFCLLLAFDVLPESTSWQLLILLIVNLFLLAATAKLWANKSSPLVTTLVVLGSFLIASAGTATGTDALSTSFAGAIAIAFTCITAGTFFTSAIFIAFLVISASASVFEFGSLRAGSDWLAPLLMLAALALHLLERLRSSCKLPRLAELVRITLPWMLLLFALGAAYYFYLTLDQTFPTQPPASPISLVGTKIEALVDYRRFYTIAFILLFLVFPWINAALDWLSVSASRAAFYLLHSDLSAANREDRAYGKAFLYLAIDLALALAFKLTVLLLLYIYARLYGEFGVSFSVETVKAYWAVLNPLDSVAFEWKKLWDTNDHKFITLMISTTLLPTLLHFGWVLLYVLCRSLWTLLRLLFAFAVSEAATFAATISVLITVAALTVLTMAIDPSDDDKNKENNKTNATQTSELLIPPPPHLPT